MWLTESPGLNFNGFMTVIVGVDLYAFQDKVDPPKFLHYADPAAKLRVRVSEKRAPPVARWGLSLANFDNQYVFAIGGFMLTTVDAYQISSNTWFSAPEMNVRRFNHASCQLGDKIYAYSGESTLGYLESMECLDVKRFLHDGPSDAASWQLIELKPGEKVRKRAHCLLAPLGSNSKDQLLILGGYTNGGLKGNAFIFDSGTGTITKCYQEPVSTEHGMVSQFRFSTIGNQSAAISTGKG